MDDKLPQALTLPAVAKRLGIAVSTIYYWRRMGYLPTTKMPDTSHVVVSGEQYRRIAAALSEGRAAIRAGVALEETIELA